MKYILLPAITLAGLLLVYSCHSNDHSHDEAHPQGEHTHGTDAHDHASGEIEALSFTVWTQRTELFVEFPPLWVGQETAFAAHFTELRHYQPVSEGELSVSLLKDGQPVLSDTVKAPGSPGIFRPVLRPERKDFYDLAFYLKTTDFTDTIILTKIPVFPNEAMARAANPPRPEGDEVAFLKEQAWKVDFAVAPAARQPIRHVIRTSGTIRPVKGEERTIIAQQSGVVFFQDKRLLAGQDIKRGVPLFAISSKGLLQSNLEEKYQVAKARLEKAKANFERAEQLKAQQIIGQKEYEQRKMDYSIAQAEFETLTDSYTSGSGKTINAPLAGIIKRVMVNDGQFVEEGTPLLEITNNRRLLLEAEVSQKYLLQLASISSANFKTSYQDSVQSLSKYNGRLVQVGKVLEPGQAFISVLFELDNLYDLIPGSFVEVYLLSHPSSDGLVIPKSAIMEDYSSKYVYVETGGESFEKRVVKLGADNGMEVQVLSGLTEGEWVVTKGAYQIKMASMSSTIPAHGHSH